MIVSFQSPGAQKVSPIWGAGSRRPAGTTRWSPTGPTEWSGDFSERSSPWRDEYDWAESRAELNRMPRVKFNQTCTSTRVRVIGKRHLATRN
jgi:hypothetical protein